MKTLLIEVGVEELPVKQIIPAVEHIRKGLLDKLEGVGIDFGEIKSFASHRRLAIIIEDASETGPSIEKQQKGPPKSMCVDKEGNYTKALKGFCSKLNIDPEDVEYKTFGERENAFANVLIPGRQLSELVSSELPNIISSYPHPHSMRWDETGIFWVRPIRWLLTLMDSELIDVRMGSLKSDRFTLSPRPKKTKKIEVSSADEYEKTLKDMGIVAGYQQRMDYIFSQAEQFAKDYGFNVSRDDRLLNELAGIVEKPFVMMGKFPEEYIKSTPDLVLRTVLVSDLRFIPFEKDGVLSNHYAHVVNGDQDIAETAMQGEMKVLLGKLSDAKFFFDKDRKNKLVGFEDDLNGIAFLKGLGTLRDKTNRLVAVADEIGEEIVEDKRKLQKASQLAKLDLATSMVREHDELQGKIGGLYSSLDGESEDICLAISQHYLPTGEADDIPQTKLSQALSLIDKADSLVNLIANGSKPKGSADPLGMRRFATGMIRILMEGDIRVNLSSVLSTVEHHAINKSDSTVNDTLEFLKPRIVNILKEKRFRHDVIQASISVGIEDIPNLLKRCQAISDVYNSSMFEGIVATAKRLKNILKDFTETNFDQKMFEKGVEADFANQAKTVLDRLGLVDDVEKQLIVLSELTEHAEIYFEEVLVNAPDKAVRTNRKRFLAWLLANIRTVSDFTLIEI